MKIILFILVVYLCYLIAQIYSYGKSTYAILTKNSYFKTCLDKGLYGEYLTFKRLKTYEKDGAKFLFNCYLPKKDGNTTEIDVLMIWKSGIYVFESKNYSGWIFGSEKAKTWTQTLPSGRGRKARKEHFLNPIFQNKLHIKCLQDVLVNETLIHSVIVFSERCSFKKLDVKNAIVIQRYDVRSTVERINQQHKDALSVDDINKICKLLYPYSQVSEQEKKDHVAAIQKGLLEENIASGVNRLLVDHHLSDDGKVESEENGDSHDQENKTDEFVKKEERICPKCGSKMTLRTARRGENKGKQFYGCSNYPKCKMIQAIELVEIMENA
jgi:hypothetical protein